MVNVFQNQCCWEFERTAESCGQLGWFTFEESNALIPVAQEAEVDCFQLR